MACDRSNVCHSIVLIMVELVGVSRVNSGAGQRVGGPKTVSKFCCACFKTQRVIKTGPKGLDKDSLVIEHIWVNKALKMGYRTYRTPAG